MLNKQKFVQPAAAVASARRQLKKRKAARYKGLQEFTELNLAGSGYVQNG